MNLKSPSVLSSSIRSSELGPKVLTRTNTTGEHASAHPSPTEPVHRVLIIERDSMSSDLLANTLARNRQLSVSCTQPQDLLRQLTTAQIDLAVISADLTHNLKNGFELASTVAQSYPATQIVILLARSSRETVISAFRSGARGVFSREQPATDFLDCVEHVRKGFIWAGGQEADYVLEAFRCMPAPDVNHGNGEPPLTERELQVVQHAAMGKTNKMIAGELRLSEHTVKNYLFRAFEKLGVSNRVELLFQLTLKGYNIRPTPSVAPPKENGAPVQI